VKFGDKLNSLMNKKGANGVIVLGLEELQAICSTSTVDISDIPLPLKVDAKSSNLVCTLNSLNDYL